MTKKKTELLEAHVRFELERLRGERLPATLAEEVADVFAWLGQVRLVEVVSAVQVVDWIKRNVIERPLSPELVGEIRENVLFVHEFLRNDDARVAAFLPRQFFDRLVDTVSGLEDLRREITHQLISSSVYGVLISNVLYRGIKAFVLTENTLAKNIPGASSLLRMGQNALNAGAPTLGKSIDKQLLAFISANVQETIRDSEAFLNTTLDASLMRTWGGEVWAANAGTEMTQLADFVDAASLETMVQIAVDAWLHFRATPLFAELTTGLVRNFFRTHGEKDVRAWLAEMGMTQAIVTQEVTLLAAPVVASALQSGFAEQSIRRRLDAFYSAYFAA
ncbi:hypothetical protein [Candidatus Amarolinea aalborgensis]|uniref:hypothetical protein n=1 Tax=Candidatus Amarolinea aalborgensis TaxID=2249329 RepID=UPI003BF96E1B